LLITRASFDLTARDGIAPASLDFCLVDSDYRARTIREGDEGAGDYCRAQAEGMTR